MYIYVFTSSTYNSACGDLEGARVSEATPPPTKIQIFYIHVLVKIPKNWPRTSWKF